MKRHQSQDNHYKEIDEHDAPTEPMPIIQPYSTNSATIANGMPANHYDIIPVPMPHEHPFPYQDVALSNPVYRPPEPSVYPVLPTAPSYNNGDRRPPGGAAPAYPIDAERPAQAASISSRKNPLPLLVGMFFVAVQFLLLARFVLKLVALAVGEEGTAWVAIIYAISSIFVLPFRLLQQNLPLSIPTSIELYTLVAILMYGLFSRILVHLLKAVLHAR